VKILGLNSKVNCDDVVGIITKIGNRKTNLGSGYVCCPYIVIDNKEILIKDIKEIFNEGL